MDRKKLNRLFIFVPVVLTIVTVAACLFLTFQARKSAENRIYTTLADLAEEQAVTIDTAVDGNFSTLDAYADGIASGDMFMLSSSRTLKLLRNAQTDSAFSNIAIAGVNGTAYFADFTSSDVSDSFCFSMSIDGKRAIEKENADVFSDQPHFVLSVPFYRNDKVAGALMGTVDNEDFRKLMESDYVETRGYSFICDSRGTIISNTRSSALDGTSLLGIIPDSSEYKKQVRNDIAMQVSGNIVYVSGGSTQYAVYRPLWINDWMLFNVVPDSAVQEYIDEYTKTPIIVTVTIVVLSLIMSAIIYFIDRNGRKNVELKQEDLRAAVSQSGRRTIKYDIYNDTAHIIGDKFWPFVLDEKKEHFVQMLTDNAVVLPDSTDMLLELQDKMRSGVQRGNADLHVHNEAGQPRWIRTDYIIVAPKNRSASHAIVTFYDNTDLREQELAYKKWQNDIAAMISNSFCYAEADLSTDFLERIEGREDMRDDAKNANNVFSKTIQEISNKVVSRNSLHEFQKFSDRSRLLSLYAQGIYSDKMELRSATKGKERWYRFEIQMAKYPSSNDIKAFIIITDIDDEMRAKESLTMLAHLDQLTGILNRSTLENSIKDALLRAKPNDLSAMFMIDLDNFKKLNDSKGHHAGDTALKKIAETLKKTFRKGDLIGRLGGDEFMVFLPSCATDKLPLIKASALVQAAQISVDGMSITASVGVSTCIGGSKDFLQLYRESDAALYKAKTTGKSQYCVSGDNYVELSEDKGDINGSSIQYQTLLENIDGGVIIASIGAEADSEIEITYISPSFYKSLDRTPEAEGKSKNSVLGLVYPSDNKILRDALSKIAETGDTTECVYRVRLGDGGIGWRHLRMASLGAPENGRRSVIGMVSDITGLKQSELHLKAAEERYRVAISQTRNVIWEVDLASRTLFFEKNIGGKSGKESRVFKNVPDGVIESGVINPRSETDYRRMFDDIYNCREGSGYAYAVLGDSGEYEWVKTRFGLLRDEEGIPYRAIGVSEKLNNIDADMRAFDEELHFGDHIEQMLLWSVCVNLSKDSVEKSTLNIGSSKLKTYTELYSERETIIVKDSDYDKLSGRISLEALLASYHSDHSWLMLEFLLHEPAGKPRWTSMVFRLTRHPISGDIYAFIYAKDIDVVKQWELSVCCPIERNSTSLLYTKETFAALFAAAMKNAEAERICSVTLIEIADINRIKAERGLAVANNVYRVLSRLCRVATEGSAAVGRLDETHIILLRTDVPASDEQRNSLELFRQRVGLILSKTMPEHELSLICGYAISPQGEACFDEMIRRALIACATAKQHPGDGIAEYVSPDNIVSAADEPAEEGEKLRILIVDDDAVSRKLLNRILSSRYTVDQADNGSDALKMLGSHEYEMMLCDLQMPGVSGWDVLESMRLNKRSSDVPVVIITSDTLSSSQVRALNMGACDVFCKPYEPEILLSRIRNIISSRRLTRIAEQNRLYEQRFQAQSHSLWLAEHDELTGLLNRQAFYRRMRERLDSDPGKKYFLMRWDMDNFKIYNDTMGVSAGDTLLRELGTGIRTSMDKDIMHGRTEADHFIFLVPEGAGTPEEIFALLEKIINSCPTGSKLTTRLGVYEITNPKLDPIIMSDRAMLALRSAKFKFNNRIGYYDDSMLASLLKERELQEDMTPALESGQFKVFFQPQYDYESGKIIGAEALARWEHPKNGMISPGVFIPIFEKNGFISRLDEYIWERSCQHLRSWMDSGLLENPVPVSVNISRIDLYDETLCDKITALTKKYDLPPDLLRLEITESAYMQNPEQLIGIVKRLQSSGFTVEMDDFGAGYSSLNMLKDVPVNILKLDVRFLSKGEDDSRGGSILSSILRMAHWLKLPVIAEGVETRAQAEYLKSLNCPYMQGFFFAKPMPAEEYEKLLSETGAAEMAGYADTDMSGMAEFWDPAAQSALIFSSFVGGAAIIEYRGDCAEIVRANDNFYSEILSTREQFAAESMNMLDHFEGEQKALFRQMLDEAVSSGKETKCELSAVRRGPDGEQFWTLNRARLLAKNRESSLIYTSVEDSTANHKNCL